MLSKAELFARLAEGHAARISVVTPNKRLSQALMLEFDAFQIAKKLKCIFREEALLGRHLSPRVCSN